MKDLCVASAPALGNGLQTLKPKDGTGGRGSSHKEEVATKPHSSPPVLVAVC